MGRRLQGSAVVVVASASFLGLLATPVAAVGHTGITAKAAILIDNQSGRVVWAHKPDRRLPPASTTKVLTSILAIKSTRLSASFRVSRGAARTAPSKIRLRAGWKLRLRDLVYAMLLNSANDASVVVAEGLAGSVARFASQMNAQARSLGAVNSNFVNPHGLPAKNHYSTARDLAKIFSAGLRLPLFRQILTTKHRTIGVASGGTRRIALRSRNRLLMSDYPIAVIGKTGWTRAAGKCFVGAAAVGDREFVFALLGSRQLWHDVKRILEQAYRVNMDARRTANSTLGAVDTDGRKSGHEDNVAGSPSYEIHLASFPGIQDANRLQRAVIQHGYGAEVERVGRGHHARYRVIVAGYRTYREAHLIARQLDRLHGLRSVVARVGA